MMEVSTAQEKSEQIFFAQPKAHHNKVADLNKTVPTDLLKMIAFFEQCQVTDKMAGILKKIAKDKKQLTEKTMAHPPATRSRESSYKQHCCHKYRDYHQSDQRDCDDCRLTIVIKTINMMIVVGATTRTQRATSPTARRMIASAITPKKRATRPCTMTSPLHQAPAICPEEGVNLVQDLLRTLVLVLGLALAQAAGATTTIMSTKIIASQAQPPSTGICTPRTMMTDITIARTKAILSLPPSPLQRQRRSAPRNRALHHQRIYVSHCMSRFQVGNQTF